MIETVDTICGIYNTEYTLTRHRDGSCTVRAPYIKWRDQSGSLGFRKITIKPRNSGDIVWFFENGTTYNNGTGLTLDAELGNFD